MMCRSTNILRMAAVLFFSAATLHAQQIAGDWQGTLNQKLRVVLRIQQAADGTLKGRIYTIDQSIPTPIPLTAITFSGNTLKFKVDDFQASYEGTLSADGKTINGTATQGKETPLLFERATKENAWTIDSSTHTIQFIPVEKDVKLEVLDWGGTGRPLVLLTGLGDTAHVFDNFAPKLTPRYHVYAITRRGFGDSSSPEPTATNYAASRLGEDVLAVIDALHLNHPILAGHSLAGEELSYIGSLHPDKVAGLIYLDAGYPYALYDQANGSFLADGKQLREQLDQILVPDKTPPDQKKFLDDLSENLQRVEKEIAQQRQDAEKLPSNTGRPRPTTPPVVVAIRSGTETFTTISAPALVIFADPHDLGPMMKDNPEARAAMEATDKRNVERQATAFERQVPTAHVVRIPNANHYVYRSNEADVIREMSAFIDTLP